MTSHTPLRLWPGVAAAVLLCILRFIVPAAVPSLFVVGMIGAVVGTLAIVLWWLFFSRAAWIDRLGAFVVMAIGMMVVVRIVHPSIAGGMMGVLPYVYTIPMMAVALVVGAMFSRRLSPSLRRAAIVACVAIACGSAALLRTDGITGETGPQLAWRWSPTAEERLLAQAAPDPSPAVATPSASPSATPPPAVAPATPIVAPAPALSEPGLTRVGPAMSEPGLTRVEWPGFRGANRDGVVGGVRIKTDWTASPPVEVWRRAIGPGWSSFAVSGDLLYTQEQRGDDEIVACYKVSSGAPVWLHRTPARFYESNGGAGPRGTPAVSADRVFALGATGVVNALDARTGRVVWTRNAEGDAGTTLPGWGYSGSPLVVGDVVIVAVSGRLVGYDIATGTPRWMSAPGSTSYSSPHLVSVDGVSQVVLLNGRSAIGVTPADGKLLWEHAWPGGAIVQPAIAPDGDVLVNSISMTGGLGVRRLHVSRGTAGWTVEERWTSNGLKPYFNDFVVHKGHAYGFDGAILAAIDLNDGTRKWKGGRYGNGQLVLLRDQDLMVVLSEEGELVLVNATPDQFTEVARVPALEGKTWNHPVLVGDLLLVRNGEEMAAYRLALASR